MMKRPWILLAGIAGHALVAPAAALAQAASAQPVAEPVAEPVADPVADAGQAGLDMVLADPEGMPAEPEFARDDLPRVEWAEWSGAPADLAGVPVHHLYTDLRRALVRYQLSWSALPQVEVPDGPPLAPGASGARVAALRQRMGFDWKTGGYDEPLAAKLRAFQAVHGLPVDGLTGDATLAALNRGSGYYERLILLNMERARRLPAPGTGDRYIVVDAGIARLTMYEGGEAVGSMKVVVGAAKSQTPMMATQLRYAAVNPYWNVPPDLVAKLIAPKVVAQGRTYLVDRRYQLLSDFTEDAVPVEPEAVDWSEVAAGHHEQRVRQLPGGANSMGRIKFLMPNKFGIYLHDTPNRALFDKDDRWVSNGCVRLEDADALAKWVFGAFPAAPDPDREERVDVAKPIPVYMTYLTAAATPDGVQFRADPYDRDAPVLAAMANSLGDLPALAKAEGPPDPLAPGAKDAAGADSLSPITEAKGKKAPVNSARPKPVAVGKQAVRTVGIKKLAPSSGAKATPGPATTVRIPAKAAVAKPPAVSASRRPAPPKAITGKKSAPKR